ncbi:MAG: ribonuclease III [Candidatus Obscuribacterales bacterium]|nr:ribonuclease III [Candidatus Obscuribacterales bacterium]
MATYTMTTSPQTSLNSRRVKELDQLSERLGVAFGRMHLLNEALTHSSSAAEQPGVKDYERLEFFGDAVLKFVISEYLLERFPDYSEGQLTEIRSVLVSDKVLAELATSLNLSKYILLGKQVQMRPSIMAQSLEAIIGAVYTDLGLFQTQHLVVKLFGNQATAIDRDDIKDNFKAELQEYTQARSQGIPTYTVMQVDGPPHDPIFSVSVSIEGKDLASASGKSKKQAEQEAAKIALSIVMGQAQKN